MLWRHGDVLIASADAIPSGARRRSSAVLVRGEITGHSHRVADPESAELYEHGRHLFLNVSAGGAMIVHEEHHPITLPAGLYRVWTQREYTPQAIRRVVD